MKLFILTLIVAVTTTTVTSSPLKKDGRGVLINRPTKEEIFNSRIKRSDTLASMMRRGIFDTRPVREELGKFDSDFDMEKHLRGVKGRPDSFESLELNVRKGEYMCGDRLCKLKPGEVPHCKDCQYRIH